jgi:hypothetical protein
MPGDIPRVDMLGGCTIAAFRMARNMGWKGSRNSIHTSDNSKLHEPSDDNVAKNSSDLATSRIW